MMANLSLSRQNLIPEKGQLIECQQDLHPSIAAAAEAPLNNRRISCPLNQPLRPGHLTDRAEARSDIGPASRLTYIPAPTERAA